MTGETPSAVKALAQDGEHAHTLHHDDHVIVCTECPFRVPEPAGYNPVGHAGMHSWKRMP